MNEEIKQINIKIPGQILDYVDTKEHLLDLFNYITKLQQEKEEANNAINWWSNKAKELQQENERLKEDIRKDKVQFETFDLAVECDKRQDIIDDYKSRCEKASEKIQYIIEYGFDYDGFNTVEILKGLIDMLVDYARESKNILQNGSDEE